MPPDTPTHPKVDACDLCHGEVVDEDGKIADTSLHVNGQVEVSFGHPEGFANPSSENFHTVAIRDAGWDLASCKSCHGADYAGGTVDVTCLTCHPKTPEDCSACHGGTGGPAPPEDLAGNTGTSFRGVGAHQAHLTESAVSRALACDECHTVPEALDAAGHVDSAMPAEVTFGELARSEDSTPAWDGTTCANTYCHGAFEGGNKASVTWTDVGAGKAACGTCHGSPPTSGHPDNDNCSMCHPRVADDDLNILDRSLHMNGEVEIGG
jgi:predicted CxxxxCH...CXXCH cytochrome family protein